VDVGAHIGWYSLKAARVLGSKGNVIAVEPNPDTVQKLRDNISASGANVIAVQPVACSDSDTVIDLFGAPRRNTRKTSMSRDNAQGKKGGEIANAVYRVRARPLDAIVREIGVSRIDLVKIDVEGAEMLVLKEAKQTLAHYSPILVLEFDEKLLQSMGTNAVELNEFLRSQGYMLRHSIGANRLFEK
jgi:FkbM family methyltransferase